MRPVRTAILLLTTISILAVLGCATYERQSGTVQGGAVGAGVGGLSGALLDRSNPWRGGIVGGALGAVLGGTVGNVAERGSYEAARADRPVEYRTERDGHHARYYAEPMRYNPNTGCRDVREEVYQDGQLVRSGIREVCDVKR